MENNVASQSSNVERDANSKEHGKQNDVASHCDANSKEHVEHASVVASHYNKLKHNNLTERMKSPIFYLRNFNNWIKSVMINEFVDKLREKHYGKPLKVLDICCGKGGDINKFHKAGNINHVVFADIANVSIQQCQERYNDFRNRGSLYSAEFIVADCTKDTLRDKYKDPTVRFDLVSCQFGFHYCFESYSQAKRMLNNISECLRPDGYFIGTLPDSNEIISRSKKSPTGEFGNRIFNIKLLFDPKEGYPLFGAKYDFNLEGVVDCPEFLVNFGLLEKLALEFGLKLVYKARFADFFKEKRKHDKQKYELLLRRILCFESYPPPPGVTLLGADHEYEHAKEFMKSSREGNKIGTMSKCEWEVATLYMVFAFKKLKSTWDKNGRPDYTNSENSKD